MEIHDCYYPESIRHKEEIGYFMALSKLLFLFLPLFTLNYSNFVAFPPNIYRVIVENIFFSCSSQSFYFLF